jgi:hypothetical protein
MKKRYSPKKQGTVARRADKISQQSGRPEEPTVHDWLKAEPELSWKYNSSAPAHQIKIDPKNPL